MPLEISAHSILVDREKRDVANQRQRNRQEHRISPSIYRNKPFR